jgi:hypothetical protein
MNKEMRKNLETVVDSIISEDTEKATAAFHSYLRAKTQEVLAEAAEYEEDSSEDDKPAKGKKGVNPFAKKAKKEDDASEDDASEDDSSEDDKKPAFLKKKIKESEGSSLGVFNKEVSRARKAKNGTTTPIKKEKVKVGSQNLK